MLNERAGSKDHTTMSTDFMIQELLIPQAGNERLKKAAQRDLIRLATEGQPSLPIRILDTFGALLIAAGESLRRQPTRSPLSYSKT
jgi:hypothetical protein